MTLLTPSILVAALAATAPGDCSWRPGKPSPQRVFTNEDLERMAACRSQTSAQPKTEASPEETRARGNRRSLEGAPSSRDSLEAREADWRAQWRSVDQKARKLRHEARELRQEAQESPRDPKKRVAGRRSPSLLLTRAERLESEASELEAEFQERARREGALPGWIRPKGR